MQTVQFVPHLSIPFPHADVCKLVDDIETEGLTAFSVVSCGTGCHLYLHESHANYVLVNADKAANNVIAVCKKYYIDTLAKVLGTNNVKQQ